MLPTAVRKSDGYQDGPREVTDVCVMGKNPGDFSPLLSTEITPSSEELEKRERKDCIEEKGEEEKRGEMRGNSRLGGGLGWGEETARREKESQVCAKPSSGFPQQLEFCQPSPNITGLSFHTPVTPTAPLHE